MLDFERFEALTFDCYGTLIDWETGILNAVRPVFVQHDIDASDEAILEAYGELEAEAEDRDYLPYREVLAEVMRGLGARFGFEPSAGELMLLAESIKDWPPFDDTVASLHRLTRRTRLGILSNVDRDLFAGSAELLDTDFAWVITAEDAGSYKPSAWNFELAIQTIGLPKDRILHVGQSLFHDIRPASAMGLATVWVNRRGSRPGSGATKPAEATPDHEVPDLATLERQMR